MTDSRENTWAYLAAFLVLAAYGSFGVFVRWTGLAGDEHAIVFWRVLFGCFFGLVVMLLSGRTRQLKVEKYLGLLLVSGAMFSFQGLATVKAINRLPVSDALFIIYLAPVLIAAFAPVFLKEKLEKATVLALLVAVVGLAFISLAQRGDGGKTFNLVGFSYAVLAAVGYAALVLILKKLREALPALTVFIYQSAVMALVMLPFAAFHAPRISSKGWASLLVLGFFHSGVLALAYVYLAKRIKAQHLGVISYIDPVSSTIFAFICLGEKPGWQTLVGGPLIIAAGLIVLFRGGIFARGEED